MKITVLMENTTADPDLHCEHGLSLYIETGDHKILFDMGQTTAFAANAQKLGVDLTAVDLAVLSHGHYDHGGGIARFLEINGRAPLYLSRYAFGPHYNGIDKYIGLDQTLRVDEFVRPRLCFTGTHETSAETAVTWNQEPMDIAIAPKETGEELPLILAPGVELYTCQERALVYPMDSDGLKIKQENQCIPEDFRHEQYLLVHEDGKRILFSGCSHRGILNIVQWFHPHILIGGFHFSKWDPDGDGRSRLDYAAAILNQHHCTYYTCHCTGQKQYDYLKNQMTDRLHYLSTGQTLQL